jgi:hypothetical protein
VLMRSLVEVMKDRKLYRNKSKIKIWIWGKKW